MKLPVGHPDLSRNVLVDGEDLAERLSRFALIVENIHSSWEFSDKDINSLRTAEALLTNLRDKVGRLQREIELMEDIGVKRRKTL